MTAKKGHIVWLMAMVLCIACSHREDPVPQTHEETGTPIRFSGGMQDVEAVTQGVKSHEAGSSQEAVTRSGMEAMTRAGRPLEELHSAFTVWGYKNMSRTGETFDELQTVFPGYTVNWQANTAMTTTTNTHDWEYVGIADQTIKYWDLSARAYRFFAVTSSISSTKEDVTSPYPPFEPQEDHTTYRVTLAVDAAANDDVIPYFSRLWFSTGELPTYEDKQFGKTVQLEFVKPLSRVRFIFIYVFPREGVNLANVSFKPSEGSTKKIARKGTVTVSYPLTGTATKETYSSTRNPSPVDGEELTEFTEYYDPEDDLKEYIYTDNGWYTVFPSMDQDSYTLSLTINSAPKTAVVPAEFMRWLPGYSYTYIFKITDEGGVEIGGVEYAVTPWVELEATHPVYNW